LTTIFQQSPAADGAVIISVEPYRRCRLLPSPPSAQLEPHLGTRHRAAIGLTEDSDARAVVVSEERGEISLALKGRIERA